ncbi:MAG: autotransporter-associated beta strand repeat-containing protein, partial [Planctomycetota bacterium]
GYANTIAFQDGSSGRIVAAHNNALGTAAGVTITSGDTLEISGVTIPFGKTVTLNGTGTDATGCFIGTGTCGWVGPFVLGSASSMGGTGTCSLSGAISGAFTLTKLGTGTFSLSGDSNAWANNLVVSAGTIVADLTTFTTVLGTAAGNTTVQDGATLRVSGATQTLPEPLNLTGIGVGGLGALQGPDTGAIAPVCSGAITLAGHTTVGVHTVGGGSLQLSNAIAASANNLTKVGVGLLYMNGNSSAWSGNLTVAAGTLKFDGTATNVNALGNTTGTTTVASGATLLAAIDSTVIVAEPITISGTGVGGIGAIAGLETGGITGTLSGAITLAADAAIGNTAGTGYLQLTGAISGAFNLTKVDAGEVDLNADNSAWGGNITVANGILGFKTATSLGDATGTTTVQNGATLELMTTNLTLSENLNIRGTGFGGNGAFWANHNSMTWNGTVTLAANALISSPNFNAKFNGIISDGGGNYTLSLYTGVNGTQTTEFAAANTYGGGTTISGGGTLIISNVQALGTPSASATVTVPSGASLQLELSGTTTLGAYPLVLAGAGSNGGTLGALYMSGAWGNTVNLPVGATITMNANTTINVSFFNFTLNVADAISGAFTLTKTGPGTLNLNGASPAWTGASTVSAGTLAAGHASALGTAAGTTTVASGANLTLSGAITPAGKPLSIGGTGI